MNGPSEHPPPSPALPERVARLEVTCERILDELREIRNDMREMRAEMREMRAEMRAELREVRSEQSELRRTSAADFRILFGALMAVAVGVAGTMARAFGWI